MRERLTINRVSALIDSPRLHRAGLWVGSQVELIRGEPRSIIDESEQLLLDNTLSALIEPQAVEVAVPLLIGRVIVA